MSEIKVLEKAVSEQIAAGEVVTRPASAVKELIENSIDAGASAVAVDIISNGIKSIRITDNGSGIPKGEVKLAFIRHATSKLREAAQLESIGTLGFRGEALPSIAAVSKLRIITKPANQDMGAELRLEGGEEAYFGEIGCADGTTIFVDDIFYNTPARMKFLKKDVSEGNAIAETVEELALAYPNVSFRLIRDGKQTLFTPGTGLQAAMFAIFPRGLFSEMLPVASDKDGYIVEGFVSAPQSARASRGFQYIYVNGRYVKNKTITAAAEEAYKSFSHKGLFPAFVISVSTDPARVDVNIHPAKTEVRFSDERAVFSAVYSAVRSSVLEYSSMPVSSVPTDTIDSKAKDEAAPSERSFAAYEAVSSQRNDYDILKKNELSDDKKSEDQSLFELHMIDDVEYVFKDNVLKKQDSQTESEQTTLYDTERAHGCTYIGQAFSTYIIMENGSDLIFVDKHAAHERYLYEKFNAYELVARQVLLDPIVVELEHEQKTALLSNSEAVEGVGFSTEDFGDKAVIVREIPIFFNDVCAKKAIEEIAAALSENGATVQPDDRKRIIQSVSCRAAVKAGDRTNDDELMALANKVISGEIPRYCPHGRPLYYILSKREIEKRFDRA